MTGNRAPTKTLHSAFAGVCLRHPISQFESKQKILSTGIFPFYLFAAVFTLLAVEISPRRRSFFSIRETIFGRTTHSLALRMLFIFSLGGLLVLFSALESAAFRAREHLFFVRWFRWILRQNRIHTKYCVKRTYFIGARAPGNHAIPHLIFSQTIFSIPIFAIQSIYRARIWNKWRRTPESPFFFPDISVEWGYTLPLQWVFVLRRHG